jgi:hypothetical protein
MKGQTPPVKQKASVQDIAKDIGAALGEVGLGGVLVQINDLFEENRRRPPRDHPSRSRYCFHIACSIMQR